MFKAFLIKSIHFRDYNFVAPKIDIDIPVINSIFKYRFIHWLKSNNNRVKINNDGFVSTISMIVVSLLGMSWVMSFVPLLLLCQLVQYCLLNFWLPSKLLKFV